MLERIVTPTKRLEEKSNAYATEGDDILGSYVIQEEADAFIAGANYILDEFEHWFTGLCKVNSDGFLMTPDIKDKFLSMFRSIEINSVNTKKKRKSL